MPTHRVRQDGERGVWAYVDVILWWSNYLSSSCLGGGFAVRGRDKSLSHSCKSEVTKVLVFAYFAFELRITQKGQKWSLEQRWHLPALILLAWFTKLIPLTLSDYLSNFRKYIAWMLMVFLDQSGVIECYNYFGGNFRLFLARTHTHSLTRTLRRT